MATTSQCWALSHSRSRKRSESTVTLRLDLLLHSFCGDNEETSHDHLLVNINPATAVIHDLHRFLAFRISLLADEPWQVGYKKQRESSACFSGVRATFGGTCSQLVVQAH